MRRGNRGKIKKGDRGDNLRGEREKKKRVLLLSIYYLYYRQ